MKTRAGHLTAETHCANARAGHAAAATQRTHARAGHSIDGIQGTSARAGAFGGGGVQVHLSGVGGFSPISPRSVIASSFPPRGDGPTGAPLLTSGERLAHRFRMTPRAGLGLAPDGLTARSNYDRPLWHVPFRSAVGARWERF